MTKFHINLPIYRLQVSLTKRRASAEDKPLLPDFEDIKNTKSGNKVSRYFRHIFEHKNIKKVLGANLAVALIATSFMPAKINVEAATDQNIIAEATGPFTTERVVQYPVGKISITQGFKVFHPGLDLDGITGDPIKPIKKGVVEAISRSKFAYGNAIIINHGDNITSLYAHLSKIFVSEGDEVTTNSVIGEMGATGRSFGDHLHLEVRDNGVPINPYLVLPR
jgi:murein DD-endopeptidase MepM/ murein hydrolase activator NlpD